MSFDAVKQSKKVNTYLGKEMQEQKKLLWPYILGDYHKLSSIFEMYYLVLFDNFL